MKKKVLAAVLMGAMVFAMTACGSTEGGNTTDNSAAAGTTDAGTTDAGTTDAGTADTTKTDAAGSAMEGEISVISREEGSGTRGAFIELFGIQEKTDAGETIDHTTEDAQVTNSTSVMMTSVANDPQAIGYISLGSLDDSVKALKVDGTEATAENVKSSTYKISRPFNIAVKDGLSETAQDFINFIMSKQGQKVVTDNNFIAIDENAPEYTAAKASGKIVVGGSSSVTPVMEKLKEAYLELNPDVSIEIQESDSTTGMEQAINGVCDIGMASRELKDSETGAGLKPQEIALDGIAVVVNKDNGMTDITSDQVKSIYTGEITNWEDLQ